MNSVIEFLSISKIIGPILIGSFTGYYGFLTVRELFRGNCIRFGVGWKVDLIPIKEAGIYAWLSTLTCGPVFLFLALGSFLTLLSEIRKNWGI